MHVLFIIQDAKQCTGASVKSDR